MDSEASGLKGLNEVSKLEEMNRALAREIPLPTGSKPFVHLHVHSAYSLLEGALPLTKLIDMAVDDSQPALAVTDRSNLFGALEYSEKAIKQGLQPIIGCTIEVALEEPTNKTEDSTYIQSKGSQEAMRALPIIVLLASTELGYQNLMKLVSEAYLEGEQGSRISVSRLQLEKYGNGLIALSGGPTGPLDMACAQGQDQLFFERFEILRSLFDDHFYIELQRHEGYSRKTEDRLVELAYSSNIPLVATNEAYFPKRQDYKAHDALICIAEGRYVREDDRRKLTPDHYLKSRDEMHALFSDLPEALDNTITIAKRCAFKVSTLEPILPF
ncbi:MAG: PHP domain-containing protein, partial [Rhizobiaceae bacterium]